MLRPFYVIPGYTFFYWGFTLPKREYSDYINFFKLKKGSLVKNITLIIGGKKYPAKVRLARITTPRFPNRNVVQIFYDTNGDTLKALRREFIYSYASTINKTKSNLKEIAELSHQKGSIFKIKPISKQVTDFDQMFLFLENKNLFEYWKNSKKGKEKNFFIDYARSWLPAEKIKDYRNRSNVIYILFNSRTEQLYVGKANKFGERVKKGEGRIGLEKDWDRFMFFEIDPEYSAFLEQIEAYTIRTFSSLLMNQVGLSPLNSKKIKLVNRQLIK